MSLAPSCSGRKALLQGGLGYVTGGFSRNKLSEENPGATRLLWNDSDGYFSLVLMPVLVVSVWPGASSSSAAGTLVVSFNGH